MIKSVDGGVTIIVSHLNLQLSYVSFPSPTTTLKMPTHRQPKCTSAGRVTSRMLLSFLLLSTPIAASGGDSARQQQQPIPILPPLPSTPQIQTPGSNEHVFVSRLTLFGTLQKADSPTTDLTACLPSRRPQPPRQAPTTRCSERRVLDVDRNRRGWKPPRRSKPTTSCSKQPYEHPPIKRQAAFCSGSYGRRSPAI
jgi:hypothetical protein